MTEGDVDGAVALQRACFPPPFPADLLWQRGHLHVHLQVFPEGQLVAEEDGQVVGSATSLVVGEENWRGHRPWEETVGGHFLARHDPSGTTLYGVDISVHPDWRGKGIGRKLYEERFATVERLGLERYGTACRIPDFQLAHSFGGELTPEAYCELVVAGEAIDRTLTPLLRYGLRYLGVIHGYMEDAESGNAAALLEWRRR